MSGHVNLMWRKCLDVVEKWFSKLWTHSEGITQLDGRKLEQNKERLRFGSLTTFHEAFPDFTILPHLQTR